jgi:tryptophan synthase alpha chain
VTGERESLAASASLIAKRQKKTTDLPVLVGVGVSTPDQAAELAVAADGVIVGSALVRRLLEGGGPGAACAFVAQLRAALDAVR